MGTIFATREGNEFKIDHAYSLPHGHGFKQIIVTVVFDDKKTEMKTLTNNMPAYDDAMDLDGQEKYEALFRLVSHILDCHIENWIDEIGGNE